MLLVKLVLILPSFVVLLTMKCTNGTGNLRLFIFVTFCEIVWAAFAYCRQQENFYRQRSLASWGAASDRLLWIEAFLTVKAFFRGCCSCFQLKKKPDFFFPPRCDFYYYQSLQGYSLRLTSWFGKVWWSCEQVKFCERIYLKWECPSHFAIKPDVLFRSVNLISSSILKKPISFWMSSFWEGKFRRHPRKMFLKPSNKQIFYRR